MLGLRLLVLAVSALFRDGFGSRQHRVIAAVCGATGTSGGHRHSESASGWRSTGGRRSGRVKGGRTPSRSDAARRP